MTVSYNIADGETSCTLDITITPSKELIHDSKLRILVDTELTLNDINNTKCLIYNEIQAQYQEFGDCFTEDRFIEVTLAKTINLGIEKKIRLSDVFIAPEFSGFYYFQLEFSNSIEIL